VAISLEYSSQSWIVIGLGSLLVLGIKSWGQTVGVFDIKRS